MAIRLSCEKRTSKRYSYSDTGTAIENFDIDDYCEFYDNSEFYVSPGECFDIDDYCDFYNIDQNLFDPQEIKAIQDAASRLTEGEYLLVYHYVVGYTLASIKNTLLLCLPDDEDIEAALKKLNEEIGENIRLDQLTIKKDTCLTTHIMGNKFCFESGKSGYLSDRNEIYYTYAVECKK